MSYDVPPSLRGIADHQRGVITRRQAQEAGLSRDVILSRVDRGRWQRLHTGVYVTFSGPVGRQPALWAAVLRAGEGAALSYQTAAELDRLTDKPASMIHITIPSSRKVMPIQGAVLHAKRDAAHAIHPTRLPPRLRVEETVFDLADTCDDPMDAIGWITSALGRKLTTQDRLRETLSRRARLRWRSDLTIVLSPDLAGVHSVLEFRYVRDVETPHGLPKATRQARASRAGVSEYRDVLYDEFAVAVELDGRVAHPGDTRWLDIQRDNAAATGGLITLRYGYREVTMTPCLVARQVAEVLRLRGWRGSARPCSAKCPLNHRLAS